MTTWSKAAWTAIAPVFDEIIRHPFVSELKAGTLEMEKFLFYLTQDSLYLSDYGRALAGIGVKSSDSAHSRDYLRFAGDTMAVEREMHLSYLGQIDVAARPSPSCLLYTSYMHRQLSLEPLEVAVATLLPCFWIYQAVGEHILSGEQVAGNRYQSWIDTYGGDEFAQAVTRAITITDELADKTTAARREEMTAAFIMCSKMEWMFWDSAWRLEKWPV